MSATISYDFIHIKESSVKPKYLQLAHAIIDAVTNGEMKINDALPSINELSYNLDISRDTVEKGYKYLKKLECIKSVPGKGYYICVNEEINGLKIALFLNKLSSHKKAIYDAFANTLGSDTIIDLYVYNNDLKYFKKSLDGLSKSYQYIVISPHFIRENEEASKIINELPKEKLVLLGSLLKDIQGEFAAVYENFEKDIFDALEQALPALKKYKTIKLVFPDNSYYPKSIIKGYYKFCQKYNFKHVLVPSLANLTLKKGDVYITLSDDELAIFLKLICASTHSLGQDVGLISYNETPFKKYILNGITTISTDFKGMGITAANLILSKKRVHKEVPFYLQLRASL